MRFSPLSFLFGLGAAALVPLVSRNFRPLAVEATALGLGLLEDLRRIAAEQMENFEDIAAEARARREELVAAAVSATRIDLDEADHASANGSESTNGSEPAHESRRVRRRSPRTRARAE